MISSESSRYEGILRRRIIELEGSVRHRNGIAIERTADQLDEARQAHAALIRIQEGSFGTCQRCDEDIQSNRLSAVPWTNFCLLCQELADRNSKETSYGYALPNAA